MSRFRVHGLFALVILVCTVSLPGCSGKSPITITLTPAGQSACGTNSTSACGVTLNQGASIAISASVANDSTNAGVTWSLGSSVGTLSTQTSTSVTYIAPVAVTQTTTATLTATSVANTSVTATVTITINAVFQFEGASLPVATVGTPYNGVVTTDGATGPFTWTLISGNFPAGLSLSNSDAASVSITGTPTTAGSSDFTLQATDSAGTPISQTFTITVNPPPSLTITTTSLPNGTVGAPYSFTLGASFGTSPYTWSIVSGSLPPPGLNAPTSAGVILGTPTAPGTFSFTVQVKDSTTPNPETATANLTIVVNQVVVNSELSGNYAFLVSGYDGSGKRLITAGSLLANGAGGITNAIVDTNDDGAVTSGVTTSGTYVAGANGLGTIELGIGLNFAFSFVPATSGVVQSANLIEFDTANTGKEGSGVLLQQTVADFTTTLATSSNYAFGLLGADGTGGRYGLAGQFAASGGTSTGVFDSDDAGAVLSDQPFAFTSFSAADPVMGRGTLATNIGGGSGRSFSFYVVSSGQVLLVEIDSTAILGGVMLVQPGAFGASSLTGAVFETTALSTAGSAPVLSQLGVLTTDGVSTLNTSFDQSTCFEQMPVNCGTQKSNSDLGTYNVAANGRTTLTGSDLSTPTDPVLYLVQGNEGFLVGTDTAVTFGFMKAQAGAPFTFNGAYAGGSIAPTISGASWCGQTGLFCSITQEVTVSSANSTLSSNFDAATSGGLAVNQTASGIAFTSPTTGRGTMPNTGTPTSVFYVVSNSPGEYWSMSLDANGLIQIFQQIGAPGIFQQ